MIEYVCEECGKICIAKYKSQAKRFCSHKCANMNRWEQKPKAVTEVVCGVCGKTFDVRNSDHRMKNRAVKYCSKECAGIASRKGTNKECPICKTVFYTTRNVCCSPDCATEYKKQMHQHKTYFENGYIIEYHNGYNKKGNVKQHRRIMEDYIGRKLNDDEIVHHVNGIKTDNRIENLTIMKKGEHSSYHRKKEKAEGKQLFGGYHNN